MRLFQPRSYLRSAGGLGGRDCPKSALDFWLAKLEGSLRLLLSPIIKRAEDFIETVCAFTVTN